MKRVHYTDNYLMNPQHPVTVNIIGAGGTGSQVLTCLARLDVTLKALNHPGLYVTLYDPDEVTEANIGRQLFSYSDFGLNKAVCLISRVNNFFGNDWKAVPHLFPSLVKEAKQDAMANITITCTDNIKSRLDMWNFLKTVRNIGNYTDYKTPLYWMDFGNAQTTGQVIMGTVQKKIPQPKSKLYKTVESLKVITQYVKYSAVKVEESGPSCSLAEALQKQDLFINSTLAQLGCNILWKMFWQGMIEHQGLYMNLDTMKVNPIGV
jgi:PRTRC system ThiF family protein